MSIGNIIYNLFTKYSVEHLNISELLNMKTKKTENTRKKETVGRKKF